jgi:hypothetical protein
MTQSEESLAAASSSIRTRAWSDFQALSRSQRFTVFAALIAAVGAGAGAIAPSDASTATRFLTGLVLALAAPLLAYSIALLWSLARAPFRQRRELISALDPADSPQPELRMEAAVDQRERKPMGMEAKYQISVAFVRVFNAQEDGGEDATAEHVTPEIKIFGPGDKLISHHKGWDVNAWRDFTTGQEEHALWLVAKRRDQEGCFLIRQEDAAVEQRLADGAYVAEITLRGWHPKAPVRKRFVFSSRGVGTDITLEDEKSA